MPTTPLDPRLHPHHRHPLASEGSDFWRQLVDQSRDGIVVLDQTGQVFWVNERFGSMLGYARDEALRLRVEDWDDNIPAGQIAEMLAEVGISGDHFETIHKRKDGSTLEVEICTNAVQFGQSKLVLCISRDISDRKRAEKEIQKALAESEELSRRLALQQEILVQSEKLASLGQLAAGIAHEINNPLSFMLSNLTCLRGYLDDLKEVGASVKRLVDIPDNAPGDETFTAVANLKSLVLAKDAEFLAGDIHQLVKDNIDGGERIREIVKNLMGFVRRDDGNPRPAQVAEMVESALVVTHNEWKNRCQIICAIEENLPPIQCCRQQMEQVLMNLLVNASHAMDSGGTIHISAAAKGPDSLEIKVEDEGSGIPPENLHQIFDPFFTTKEVGKGTGLGLHIVHSIVQRHGGKIAVESKVGSGTTFSLTLPLDLAGNPLP